MKWLNRLIGSLVEACGNKLESSYVICRIVSSIDGKINGSWFGMEEVRHALAESNRIRDGYRCGAVLYGYVTMAETYANGYVTELAAFPVQYSREDYIADPGAELYFVCYRLYLKRRRKEGLQSIPSGGFV